MNHTTPSLGPNMERRIYTGDEIKAFTEGLSAQDVQRYYSPSEANAMTYDSVRQLLEGSKTDSLDMFPDYGQWLTLRCLQSRLMWQRWAIERIAVNYVGRFALRSLLIFLLGVILSGLLKSQPWIGGSLMTAGFVLASIPFIFHSKIARQLEREVDQRPLSERLEASKHWHDSHDASSNIEIYLEAGRVPASEVQQSAQTVQIPRHITATTEATSKWIKFLMLVSGASVPLSIYGAVSSSGNAQMFSIYSIFICLVIFFLLKGPIRWWFHG